MAGTSKGCCKTAGGFAFISQCCCFPITCCLSGIAHSNGIVSRCRTVIAIGSSMLPLCVCVSAYRHTIYSFSICFSTYSNTILACFFIFIINIYMTV